jgi:hypothetical protein
MGNERIASAIFRVIDGGFCESTMFVYELSEIVNCGTRLNRFSLGLVLGLLALLSFSFASPAFATTPVIRNVAVSKIGNSYFLDITIYHTPEDQSNYVDLIRVIIYAQDNITDLHIGPQALSADDTFTISYDLGPLPGDSASIEVAAHCNVNSWNAVPWWGDVPEFSLPIMLVAFALATSFGVFVLRRAKLVTHE